MTGLRLSLAVICSFVLHSVVTEATCLQVAAIHLTADAFSVENGLLTPTFKLKRPQAKQQFSQAIDAMYNTLSK